MQSLAILLLVLPSAALPSTSPTRRAAAESADSAAGKGKGAGGFSPPAKGKGGGAAFAPGKGKGGGGGGGGGGLAFKGGGGKGKGGGRVHSPAQEALARATGSALFLTPESDTEDVVWVKSVAKSGTTWLTTLMQILLNLHCGVVEVAAPEPATPTRRAASEAGRTCRYAVSLRARGLGQFADELHRTARACGNGRSSSFPLLAGGHAHLHARRRHASGRDGQPHHFHVPRPAGGGGELSVPPEPRGLA